MNRAKYNTPIDIYRQDDTTDSFGDPLTDEILVTRTWAHIHPLEGEEVFAANQVESSLSHRIRIPYEDALRPMATMTAKWLGKLDDGRTFDFTSVANKDERNRVIEIMAQEFKQ